MDIVVHGIYHNNKYRIKCSRCGCIYDCSEYDLHNYCGLGEKIYVNCPECNKWNNITKDKIKTSIRRA